MANRSISYKSLILCFTLGLVLVLLASGTLKLLLNPAVLTEQVRQAEGWGAGWFVIAHVITTALGLPGTVLVVVGGAVFGLMWGTFWSVIGATLGAIAAFYLARYLLRDWVEQRFGQHRALLWIKRMGDRQALSCVLAVRFVPISPFNLVNFLFGLTDIAPQPYAIGTCLGIIPGTMAYTWIGVTGNQALQGEGLIPLLVALSALALLSLIPIIAQQKH